MTRIILPALALALLGKIASCQEVLPPPAEGKPAAQRSPQEVRAFLAAHCLECHGPEKPKGKFRVDQLSGNFADQAGRERWLAALQRIRAGEMPPKEKPRPPEKEIGALTAWVSSRADEAE